jgi:excisionase family DNA binding protein
LAKLQDIGLAHSSRFPSRASCRCSATAVAVRLHSAFNLSRSRVLLGLEIEWSQVSECLATIAFTNRFDRDHGRPQAPSCSHPTASAREFPYQPSEEALMADAQIRFQRLLRTKEAAAYLCMSEWKLRRLIQGEIIPIVQDQPGGPFLLDLRDLDAYIESNKHHFGDSDGWRPTPVLLSPAHPGPQSVRRVK